MNKLIERQTGKWRYHLRRGLGGDGLQRPEGGTRRGGELRRTGRGCGFGTCTVAAVTC